MANRPNIENALLGALRRGGETFALLAALAALAACGNRGEVAASAPQVIEAELPPMVLGAAPLSGESANASARTPGQAPVPLPPPPQPLPPPPAEEHQITVQSGETLGLYERWSGIAEDDLKEQNGLRRARGLRVGQSFVLTMTPEQAVQFARIRREFHRRREESFFRTHEIVRLMAYVVRPGDSLRAISKRYSDVPRWLMEKVNLGHDLRRLRPGDIINLPVIREAAPASQREAEARAAALEAAGSGWTEPAYRLPRPSGHVEIQRAPLDGGAARPSARRSAWDGDDDGDDGGVESGRQRRSASADVVRSDGTWFSDEVGDGPPKAPVVDVRVKVRKGECLALYSKWSGVSTATIARTNDLLDPSRLRIGQELRIALPESKVGDFYEQRRRHLNGDAPAVGATLSRGDAPSRDELAGGTFPYTVRSGDTAWEIAVKRFSISVPELARLNPDRNLDRLRVGDTLQIPMSAIQ